MPQEYENGLPFSDFLAYTAFAVTNLVTAEPYYFINRKGVRGFTPELSDLRMQIGQTQIMLLLNWLKSPV